MNHAPHPRFETPPPTLQELRAPEGLRRFLQRQCTELRAFQFVDVVPHVLSQLGDVSEVASRHPRQYGGILQRSYLWMTTLAELGKTELDPSHHVQAFGAAARATLEMAIDTTLLRHDPGNPLAKYHAHEQSSRLEVACAAFSTACRAGEWTQEAQVAAETINREAAVVQRLRRRWWPDRRGRPRHPMRWTGRHLPDDSQEADRLSGHSFSTRMSRSHYKWAHALVHGSGVQTVGRMFELPDASIMFAMMTWQQTAAVTLNVLKLADASTGGPPSVLTAQLVEAVRVACALEPK